MILQRLTRLFRENTLFIFCLIFLLANVGAIYFPTSFWYELRSVKVQDSVVGEKNIKMAIDRAIKRPFIGNWAVSVRRVTSGVNDVVCVGSGTQNYRPNLELPESLNLRWWIGHECLLDSPGFYRVTTTVTIEVFNFLQPKIVLMDSNIFEVKQ